MADKWKENLKNLGFFFLAGSTLTRPADKFSLVLFQSSLQLFTCSPLGSPDDCNCGSCLLA